MRQEMTMHEDETFEERSYRQDARVQAKLAAVPEGIPFHWALCDLCSGKGTVVSPSIDANGLTSEDFDGDPDFARDYFEGVYDIPCPRCAGRTTIPVPDHEWYVTVYEVNRAYGGPEEGGWYYDDGSVIKALGPYIDRKTAEEVCDDIDRQPEDVNEPGHYHMGHGEHDGADGTGEGDDRYLIPGGLWGRAKITTVIGNAPGKNFPENRPHYE
jgi:hypothetical protein